MVEEDVEVDIVEQVDDGIVGEDINIDFFKTMYICMYVNCDIPAWGKVVAAFK
jgi:hypothetical protein